MSKSGKLSFNPNLVVPTGTQVVTRVPKMVGSQAEPLPEGSVGDIAETTLDNFHSYRIRFPDGTVASYKRTDFHLRRQHQNVDIDRSPTGLADFDLHSEHIIFRCVVGSRAFGLDVNGSDKDLRGIFLPPAEMLWSLYGIPEQLEDAGSEECYWELEKFLVLALKANPNVLECLWTPLVELATPLAHELLEMRAAFLSKVIYQTCNGYVISQFRKLEQDMRSRGEIRVKHAMHLIRLLLSGRVAMREHRIMVDVAEHRDRLLAIRSGEMPWDEVNKRRLDLHSEFESAFTTTTLPDRPDYDKVNAFLVRARKEMVR